MKYIRTKKHIIKEGDEININEIIKKADTIEELIDGIVRISKEENAMPIAYNFRYSREWEGKVNVDFVKEFINLANINAKKIYGFIWTDKGLIYVAKMNEKGELELL